MIQYSRRKLIGTAGAALCLPAVADGAGVITPHEFADPKSLEVDATDAIRRAVSRLQPGNTLYFPAGIYRCAQPKTPGLVLSNKISITVSFAPGAELLMDNAVNGYYGQPGILVTGHSHDISLNHTAVRYARMSTSRENGFGGICIHGPAPLLDSASLTNVTLTQPRVINSPSTMYYAVNCSDILFDRPYGHTSWADGIYCRFHERTFVRGGSIIASGDDALSFGRYGLGEALSGQGSVAENVVVDGVYERVSSDASAGIFIGGARSSTFRNITIRNRDKAVRFDVGKSHWLFQPPTKITIDGITADGCKIGLHAYATAGDSGWQAPTYYASSVFLRQIRFRKCDQAIMMGDQYSGWLGGFSISNLYSTNDVVPSALTKVLDFQFTDVHINSSLNIDDDWPRGAGTPPTDLFRFDRAPTPSFGRTHPKPVLNETDKAMSLSS